MSFIEYSEDFAANVRAAPNNVHNCKMCPHVTTSIFLMVNHVRRHRSSLPRFCCESGNVEIYHCKDCDFKTDLTMLMKKHLKDHHVKKPKRTDSSTVEDTVKNYVCKNCDFGTYSLLHWIKHSGKCLNNNENREVTKPSQTTVDVAAKNEKWYECDKCDRKYTKPNSLAKHKTLTHRNKPVRWLSCAVCPYKSKERGNLKKHIIRRHLDEEEIKWYECQKCKYKARFISYLNTHVNKWHSNKDESECQCGKCRETIDVEKYIRRDEVCEQDVSKGVQTKQAKEKASKWLQCINCGFECRDKRNLKRHIKRCHFK